MLPAPSRPPSNVASEAPSPSSLRLSWKPVDKQHLNGILRAYVITYFETKSPDDTRNNITISVTNGRKRRAIADPSSPSFELDGLKVFTDYTVQVMAYTVDYGVPSQQMNFTTAQDGKTVCFLFDDSDNNNKNNNNALVFDGHKKITMIFHLCLRSPISC